MCQTRLNGLMLLYVYDDLELSVEQVIDNFALKNKRRLDFVI